MQPTDDDDRLTIILAEYATTHVDGTSTIVRGWIDRWTVTAFPTEVSLFALLDVPLGDGWSEAPMSVTITGPTGEQVMAIDGMIERTILVPDARRFQGVMPLQLRFVAPGPHQIVFTIGAALRRALTVRVIMKEG